MNLGFKKENIVHIPMKENIGRHYETVKHRLLQDPNIQSVSAKDCLPTVHINRTTGIDWEGRRPDQKYIGVETLQVDYDYFKTLGLEIIDGRRFSKVFTNDPTQAYILNEEAVKRLDLEAPAVGKRFALYGQQGAIIGIMKDACLKSLHKTVEPQVYHMITDPADETTEGFVFIRIKGDHIPQTLASIESVWKSVNPVFPFEFQFLDTTYDNLYKKEMRIGTILGYSTVLAVFIACLGIFGLASFTAERRIKEIGVRRVLGASVWGVVRMLNREFTKWVLVANFVAWPVSYFVMTRWLMGYAYRIGIGWWMFILAGGLALAVALLTVSFQSFKAARTNPVESLRYE
jgi:putative ABC transport system permease protein